jgi:hypothetical protein
MKKLILILPGIFCFMLVNAQQVTVDGLKKENARLKSQISALKQDTAYLHQVVITCNLLSKSGEFTVWNSNSKYKIEILGCYGDRNAQTVSIDFMLSHPLPHQLFQLHTGSGAPTAFDNLGNSFACRGSTSIRALYCKVA